MGLGHVRVVGEEERQLDRAADRLRPDGLDPGNGRERELQRTGQPGQHRRCRRSRQRGHHLVAREGHLGIDAFGQLQGRPDAGGSASDRDEQDAAAVPEGEGTGARLALPSCTISTPGPSVPPTTASRGTSSVPRCTSTITRAWATEFAFRIPDELGTRMRTSAAPVAGSTAGATASTVPANLWSGAASTTIVAS